ncbi:MAG: D-alanyl-D-alanine carboxypeptidase [Lautropia sp.]|nr:MAG: D-alanyl-D-alanine carboxypeptidase [Pseudomonadota bacterium]MBC6960305.1 D-alanyl-D-alanine carboxypeptidase [Lautropia sp.]MCL4701970.1 D-alanyl-D-alanine carboxypeptidase [Burkholderiaceae bacterium]MCZ2414749.1 D-alanyl-D-alanine carboxypeptidase [Burkholderiales bacterium]MDL1906068.1 D-alanyl-D-alanine carboxypeptidase [Betaproteobacteria bacterium PRO1]
MPRSTLRSLLLLLLVLLPFATPRPALSQVAAPTIAARSWLLLDATSGQVLAAHEPDLKVEPASLTKVMTAYLAFGALREKRLALDQRPPVSQAAYKAGGSRMFVDPRDPASVEQLLNGMIVQSGNDASIVLAEALAGTEEIFAQQMNREAQRLGLRNTRFRNATGLPDPEHYSTARDLATMAARLISDFPEYYPLYSKREYTYNNIRQPNRNRLLAVDPSVDGMKTGHTEAAGYCLIASAHRKQPGLDGERRLVSVVIGANSESTRAIESQKLLNYGFQNFDAVRVYAKGQPAGTYQVWKGAVDTVAGGFDSDLVVTVPRGQAEKMKAEVERVQPLVAPIAQGQRIGTLRVKIEDRVLVERPLLALAAVEPAGWFGRTWDGLRMMLSK